jgi:predicted MFS family arabinose efflux permease
MIGIAASGFMSEAIGWRRTFVVLGVTGLLLAPVVLVTLREPPRGGHGHAAAPMPPFRDSMRTLWQLRAFRNSAIGGALIAYPLNSVLLWNAPFYSRVFGLSLREMAVWLALLAGGAGAIGLFGGGLVADRLGRRSPRWYMLVPALGGLAVAPFMLLQYFTGQVWVSFASGAIAVMLLNAFVPPQVAATQALVPTNLRATASATNVLFAGTFGAALGPFLTGVISDVLATRYGLEHDSLRYAIGGSALLATAGGYLFLRASRHFPAELAMRASTQAPP